MKKTMNFWAVARELLRPFDRDPPDVRLQALDKVASIAKWRTIAFVICAIAGPVLYAARHHL